MTAPRSRLLGHGRVPKGFRVAGSRKPPRRVRGARTVKIIGSVVPTLLSVVAVIVATAAYRDQHSANSVSISQAAQGQAAKISYWAAPEKTGSYGIYIQNASASPISDVWLGRIVPGIGSAWEPIGAIAPCTVDVFTGSKADLDHVEISFIDGAGHEWERNTSGELESESLEGLATGGVIVGSSVLSYSATASAACS